MQFDFNLPPNQSQHIDVKGTFVKYKNGTGLIRVRLNGGGYIDLLPGQGVNNVDFNSIDVQDRSGLQNAGIVLAGIYDFRDDRIAGTVDVVDGGRTRTLNNQAFIVWNDLGPDAVNQGMHQLWNPAGSGKNIIVEQIQISSSSAIYAAIGFKSVSLASSSGLGASKKAGGALSVGQIRYALANPAAFDVGLFTTKLSPGVNYDRKFNEPVLLPPGFGLVIYSGSTNAEIAVGFEWFEENI